ncbi:MAG: glucose-6-phosphate isomerase [Anaerolineae bacterium]
MVVKRSEKYGSANLGTYREAVEKALVQMAQQKGIARIWSHDHTVWKREPTEITNRLGWLHIAEAMLAQVPQLEELANEVRAEGYRHALLLGMGGSSLAPEVFRLTFGVKDGYLDLAVLDSTVPGVILDHAERLDLTRTLFLISTKSGTTVETLSLFQFFYNQVAQRVGFNQAGRHFVAITDPNTKVVHLAERYRFRTVLFGDPNIGGRFSAFSNFGLVPAALIGMDVRLLLERALEASAHCAPSVGGKQNPGAWLGAILGTLARMGRDKLTLVISPSIASLGNWLEQLIAESTGKEGQGILPVVGEPLGSPEVYGRDRLFVALQLAGQETHDAALAALEAAGHLVVRLYLRDRYDVGRQMFLWEMSTAVAGHYLGINPFDQPNVESSKQRAREMIRVYMETGALPPVASAPLSPANLLAFLAPAQAGDYVALQAYVAPTAETEAALQTLRTKLRDRLKLAVTVGYGPRFLHSTGQLHKGDAGNGFFIQFTADDARDVPIPDEAGSSSSSLTFGLLKEAQVRGDQQALLEAGRRVIRFHLGDDVSSALQCLADFPY